MEPMEVCEPEVPTTPKKEQIERNVEEDVLRLNEERWPEVNGVYDADGGWHEWNDLTYGFSYENSELIILPYTVCLINLPGQQYVKNTE